MRTSESPIRFRKRPDLQITVQRFGTDRYYVIQDPVSLRFTRLRDDEYALFELLDGEHSLEDLVNFYEARFAPARLRSDEAAQFVGMLQSSGLLLAEKTGQSDALHEQAEKRKGQEFRKRWTSPLAVRFRGLDPQTLFAVLHPLVRPFLSRFGLFCGLAFIAAAGVTAGLHWRSLSAQLADFQSYFTPTNVLIMMGTLGVIKILHEFGHGLTCVHFGGRCHELGVMFLVFTPCLYCNVTDAYRFPNKWHRAAVGAAGIYVELLLASAALFIWSATEPGLLHQVCLGVAALCSISTLVFNGNPFMRYDGYYVLCDLAETPNLAERSAGVVRAGMLALFSKQGGGGDPFLPRRRRGWYAAYAIVSTAYRLSVTAAIVLMLVYLARPYKLENVARALGMVAVVSLILNPLRRLFQFMNVPGRRGDLRLGRLAVAGAAVTAAAVGFFLLPLPHRVVGPLELSPYRPQRVFTEVRGVVATAPFRFGQAVHDGDVLLTLDNPELELALEQLVAERSKHVLKLESLQREQFDKGAAAALIPQTEQLLAAVDAQLAERQRERDRMTLRAARDGVWIPPPHLPAQGSADELPGWVGRPSDPQNVGATLEPGTLVGEVADERLWEAWIVVDQEDVRLIRTGDRVDILLDADRGRILRGTVDEISQGELLDTPQRLSSKAGGEVATVPNRSGERPVSTSYSVRVRLADEQKEFRVGWRGTARIQLPPSSLASRVGRWAARTFHFHL